MDYCRRDKCEGPSAALESCLISIDFFVFQRIVTVFFLKSIAVTIATKDAESNTSWAAYLEMFLSAEKLWDTRCQRFRSGWDVLIHHVQNALFVPK